MTPQENLHYAIGEMAYAVAKADGRVQKEEHKKFRGIVEAELHLKNYNFDISDIIFRILEKEKFSVRDAYNSAMNQIRNNSHYLSPEMKETFIKVMEKVSKAYPPVTIDETDILEKFKADIEPLKGDPVYYKD